MIFKADVNWDLNDREIVFLDAVNEDVARDVIHDNLAGKDDNPLVNAIAPVALADVPDGSTIH